MPLAATVPLQFQNGTCEWLAKGKVSWWQGRAVCSLFGINLNAHPGPTEQVYSSHAVHVLTRLRAVYILVVEREAAAKRGPRRAAIAADFNICPVCILWRPAQSYDRGINLTANMRDQF